MNYYLASYESKKYIELFTVQRSIKLPTIPDHPKLFSKEECSDYYLEILNKENIIETISENVNKLKDKYRSKDDLENYQKSYLPKVIKSMIEFIKDYDSDTLFIISEYGSCPWDELEENNEEWELIT